MYRALSEPWTSEVCVAQTENKGLSRGRGATHANLATLKSLLPSQRNTRDWKLTDRNVLERGPDVNVPIDLIGRNFFR